jgi:hypothetical protein
MLSAPIAGVVLADDVLTLRPDCIWCGRRVHLRFVGWKDRNYPRNPEWDCPYCRKTNVLATHGLVIGATPIPE